MRMRLLLFCCILFPAVSIGQYANFKSRSEIGLMIGGANYIGDLNPFKPYYNIQPAVGLIYRYMIHPRLSFRANATAGWVGASDADAENPLLVNRNLSFRSYIMEVGAGVEFNYFPFQLGHSKYKGTAYLLAELAVFRMNPQMNIDGEWYDLRPLGTEGQGSSLNSKAPYSLTQVSVPLGIGCKLSLGRKASLSFEYGIRKTFTDYIDDVGSDAYVDPVQLGAENGPLAAYVSNRSLNGSRYGKRGTSATKDWYSFFGMMVAFRIGSPNKCFY
jgi:hypothetical protein